MKVKREREEGKEERASSRRMRCSWSRKTRRRRWHNFYLPIGHDIRDDSRDETWEMRSEESSKKSKSKSNWKMNFMKWQQTINKARKVNEMSKGNRANSVCVCGNHDKCSALVRYLKVSVVVAVSVSVSRSLYLPLHRPRSHWSVEHASLPECYVTYSQYSEATLHPLSLSTLSLSTDIHKVLICIVMDNDRPRDKPQF